MDQTSLLVLVVAIVTATVALGAIATRPRAAPRGAGADSPIGVATEGMKVCPGCGMGNLWTERRCSACRSELRG